MIESKSDRTVYLSKIIHIPIDEECYELINSYAIEERRTMASYCRCILWNYINKKENKKNDEQQH